MKINFKLEKNFEVLGFTTLLILSVYIFFKYGIACHYEEWTGRGLYPALAFAHGFDLYETTEGPLVTLYGFGTALFYAFAGIAESPKQAIWIAYILNLVGLSVPLSYLFFVCLRTWNSKFLSLSLLSTSLTLICFFLFQIEDTTLGTLKIHADTPALSFILFGLAFFYKYEQEKKIGFLLLASLTLTLATWSKLPALPSIFFPFLYFLLDSRFRESFIYIFVSLCIFSLFSFLVFWAYDFDDVYYFIVEFVSWSKWSLRNELFDGTGAVLKSMGYLEASPLLFRFFVMYLSEYWYILLFSVSLFFISFNTVGPFKIISRSISLISILTLPSCLAHLARFGAVENALIFTNTFGILATTFCVIFVFLYGKNITHQKSFIIILGCILALPSLRISNSLPSSTIKSPHQQAFRYLKTGRKDVYFGWYPISHLLHSGKNVSCIEVPTWVGMNQPEAIRYDLGHIPPDAIYLATSPTGYGRTMLEQYIGKLDECSPPEELSSWRMYRIRAKQSPSL